VITHKRKNKARVPVAKKNTTFKSENQFLTGNSPLSFESFALAFLARA
jgi:hypothetical protein